MILVHFKENVSGNEVQTVVAQSPTVAQHAAAPEATPSRNPITTSTPLPSNLPAHPNQVALMTSPARVARQLLRDPMMGINISPRVNTVTASAAARNARFDSAPQNLTTAAPPLAGAPTTSGLLTNEFPESLLADSLLMSRLYPNELETDASSKPGQQNTTISIDIDSDDSLGEETFEFINKLGELKTMKKEKVMKKMKRSTTDAKSVIVIDDHSSEGGPDSVQSLQAAPGPSPLSTTTFSLTTNSAAALPMDDFPAAELLTPQDSQTESSISSTISMPVTAGLADIKMSIANMNSTGPGTLKGDILHSVTDPVIGHIVKSSLAEANSATTESPQRLSSRSK